MSFLVLHMDKFKKEAVRGIQSHNERERESHSNPDIDYERSARNYELCDHATENYAVAIQSRIDDLLLVKAVRKDAVHMCGLIVSSDSAFFEKLSPYHTKRFFEESRAFLTEFIGAENVISAKVHMDEKTPHMHFLHVPVTEDGRLNANKIYTRESLKRLQTELPAYLQSKGFDLQRGVEQEPGGAKKHLNTREFKQQQEALHNLEKEAQAVSAELEQRQREESELQKRLQSIEQQAQAADKILAEQPEIPKATILNFKTALEKAQEIIEQQSKALADRSILTAKNQKQQTEIQNLNQKVSAQSDQIMHLTVDKAQEQKKSNAALKKYMDANENLSARLEEFEKFLRWDTEANRRHLEYRQERQREAQQKAAEERQRKWEIEQRERQRQEEQARQTKELEQQKALEVERQREERELAKARSLERRPRGKGMSR